METLPIGWTLHTCDQQEGDRAGLLKRGVADTNSNTHVQDLFHEDAQVWCLRLKMNVIMLMLKSQQAALTVVCLWSGLPAVQPAMVEDQTVCVGAGALWYLGWRFHHLHDQYLRCGAIPIYRLPGG